MPDLTLAMTGLMLRLLVRFDESRREGRDRGDVPGWVLITVMTAGLVTAIWVVARDQLRDLLSNALESVTEPKDG